MDNIYMKGELLRVVTVDAEVYEGRFEDMDLDKSKITLGSVKLPNQDTIDEMCHFFRPEVQTIVKLKSEDNLVDNMKRSLKITQKEYEDILKVYNKYVFINQVDKTYHEALDDLNQYGYVAVATDGAEMGRKCKIPFLTLSTPQQIYIFDIQVMQYHAFDGGLKQLLESDVPKKIVHDCRKLSDCLKHKHNVELKSVFDTQNTDLPATGSGSDGGGFWNTDLPVTSGAERELPDGEATGVGERKFPKTNFPATCDEEGGLPNTDSTATGGHVHRLPDTDVPTTAGDERRFLYMNLPVYGDDERGLPNTDSTATDGNVHKLPDTDLPTTAGDEPMFLNTNFSVNGDDERGLPNTDSTATDGDVDRLPDTDLPTTAGDERRFPKTNLPANGDDEGGLSNMNSTATAGDVHRLLDTDLPTTAGDERRFLNMNLPVNGEDERGLPNMDSTATDGDVYRLPDTDLTTTGDDERVFPNTDFSATGDDVRRFPDTDLSTTAGDERSFLNMDLPFNGDDERGLQSMDSTATDGDVHRLPDTDLPTTSNDELGFPNTDFSATGDDVRRFRDTEISANGDDEGVFPHTNLPAADEDERGFLVTDLISATCGDERGFPDTNISATGNGGQGFSDVDLPATGSQGQIPSCSKTPTSAQSKNKRTRFSKSYLDYNSDSYDENKAILRDVFGENTGSDWSEKNQEIIDPMCPRKKKKNLRKERKLQKEKGEEHTTYVGTEIRARKLEPNPCSGKKCGNECGSIIEEKRQSLFDHFQKLSVQRRSDWIASNAVVTNIKRRRVDDAEPKRNVTVKYYINEGESRRQVCRQFLVSTLDVSKKFISCTIENSEGFGKADERGKHRPANKTNPRAVEYAKKYISSLPAVPSHYCRKETSRVYIPQEFKNPSHLYRLYKKYILKVEKLDNELVLSKKLFKKIFNCEFNISFHVPKKDKCSICVKFENNSENTSECPQKIIHDTDKRDSLERFSFHQNLKTKTTICASFDLQKVLNTPHGESMLLYYSRKYACYNLTVYESETRNGYCYVWGEADAKRGAKEIATCIYQYMQEVDKREIKNLILYSDSCPGQNKNKTLLSMLNYALKKCSHIESIQINYLLPGHTYMPVDSVHSVIEREVRNIIVWAPSQWPTLIESARKKPKPYNVTVMENFLDWDLITNKTFTKSSKNLRISQVRIATFKKSKPDQMVVKYSMSDNAEKICFQLPNCDKKKPSNLYKGKLPITGAKYKDLKKLCDTGIIPKRYHQEYFALHYDNGVRDELCETDEDDITDTCNE